MEDQNYFFKTEDPQEDDIVFYTEDDVPICVDIENLVVLGSNEDSPNVKFENDDPVESNDLKVHVEQTSETPKISNCSAQNKQPSKLWRQKDVTIKTIESEFKVVMWVLGDNDQNEQSKTKSKEKQAKHEHTPPIVSLLKPKHVPKNSKAPNKIQYNMCTFENCPKGFKDISSLRKHLQTHGPKTKVCAECGKAFIDNSKLNRHLIVHTGEKPYKCCFKGCGKRFSLDFNLRTHARIHTGYRPFTCTFDGCSKRFAQSTNLKSHQKIHLKRIQADKNSDILKLVN